MPPATASTSAPHAVHAPVRRRVRRRAITTVAPRTPARALDEAFSVNHAELERIAHRLLRGERTDHTLEPAALVNELYLKFLNHRNFAFTDRRHFIALATRAMRQVLITHAHRRNAEKRTAPGDRIGLEHAEDASAALHRVSGDAPDALVELSEILEQLEGFDSDLARIVELRFLGGLNNHEVAEVLERPLRSVERDWTVARAWLRRRYESADEGQRAAS